MSILNEPSDGTLAVLVALRGTLRAYGPMSSERLLALCAPRTVTEDERARFTLHRWVHLGAFIEKGSTVQLAKAIGTEATDDIDALRAALLEIVLRPENSPAKTSQGRDRDAESRARDFVVAASWCLLQDPFTFKSSFEEYVDPLQKDQGVNAVQNDVRWNGFVRWSTFLGMAVRVPDGILPNPAFAVSRALPDVLPVGKRMELGPVLDRLVSKVPVLPGGVASARVAAEGKPWRTFAPHEVAPTTALALLQLRESGAIQLTKLSDANVRQFLGRGGRIIDELTHVERTA